MHFAFTFVNSTIFIHRDNFRPDNIDNGMSIVFVAINKSSHQRCSLRKGVLRISQNSQENTCAKVSFLIKLQG